MNCRGFTELQSVALVLPEAVAKHYSMDEVPESRALASHSLDDAVYGRAISTVQFTSNSIGEKLLGETTGEGFVPDANQFPELDA